MRRTFATQARTLEELQFRRVVLGIGALAAGFGTVVFALAVMVWQFDLVPVYVLWMISTWGFVNLVAAWATVRRLASYLEPSRKLSEERDGDGPSAGS